MITQTTGKRTLKPWQGGLLTVSCIALIYAVNIVLSFCVAMGLKRLYGSILLWAFVAAMFLFVLKRYCLVDMYTLDGTKFIVYRTYIKKPRFCEQILLREVAFLGDPVTAAKRFAIKRTRKYGSVRDQYAVQSLVYKREGKYQQLLITPNEEICKAIVENLKN